jgi:hypothetical protein
VEAVCTKKKSLQAEAAETFIKVKNLVPANLSAAALIGGTILRAVSDILRTQRGRRGSGLRRQLAVISCTGLVRRSRAGHRRLWSLRLRPSSLRPCGSTLRPYGSILRSSPLWLITSPVTACGSTLRPSPLWLSCSPSAGGAAAGLVPGHKPTRILPARAPGGPGTRGAGLEVITVRVHSGHDSFPVRAESAHPTSAEQLAQPPFPLNPASGVNRRF